MTYQLSRIGEGIVDIREVGKRKEYFHPCREDKVVLLMLVNMPERLTLLTSRYSKVII